MTLSPLGRGSVLVSLSIVLSLHLTFCTLCTPLLGQMPQPEVDLPARFDLGPLTTPQVATGYENVHPGQVYFLGIQPVGWSSPAASSFDGDIKDNVYPDLGNLDDLDVVEPLLRDGHVLDAPRTFKVRVGGTATWVRVKVVLGRHDAPVSNMHLYAFKNANPAREITIERTPHPSVPTWQTISRGAWARTLRANKSTAPQSGNFGGFSTFWFDKKINNNRVVALHFAPEDSPELDDDGTVAVAAIELYPIEDPGAAPSATDRFHPPGVFHLLPQPNLEENPDYEFAGGSEDLFREGTDALMANDVSLAFEKFDMIDEMVDPFAKAAGLLWVAGWLDDESSVDGVIVSTGGPLLGQDGLEWECIERAIDLLEGGSADENPYAREDLENARAYRRALVHHVMNEFTSVQIPLGSSAVSNPFSFDPNEQGKGIRNRNVAEATWRDLSTQHPDSWLAEYIDQPNDVRGVRIHPLFFKSVVYLQANYYGRDPLYSSDVTFLEQHVSISEAFDNHGLRTYPAPFQGPFSQHATLAVLQHAGLYEVNESPAYPLSNNDSIGRDWLGEGRDTVFGLTPPPLWWDNYLTNAPPSCAASDWAREQHHLRRSIISVARWWNTKRRFRGEYGGSGGDDVELAQTWLLGTQPFPGSDPIASKGSGLIGDENLEAESATFFPDNNPPDPCKSQDSEHNGETIGNPIRAGLSIEVGDPYLLDYAKRSTSYMSQPIAGGWDWMGIIGSGEFDNYQFDLVSQNRHVDPAKGSDLDLRWFLSWQADASGAVYALPPAPADPPVLTDNDLPDPPCSAETRGDIPLNGRVIQPALFSVGTHRNPKTLQLLREWAEMWWYVAMDRDGLLFNDANDLPPLSQQKPFGAIPPIFDVEADRILYGNPNESNLGQRNWFDPPVLTSGIQFAYNAAVGNSEFLYHLFLSRYLDPETPDDNADYLLPIYSVCRYLARLEAETDSELATMLSGDLQDLEPFFSTAPGANKWLANRYAETDPILWQVVRALPSLHAGANLVAQALSLHVGFADDANTVTDVLEGARRSLVTNGGGGYLSLLMDTDNPGIDGSELTVNFRNQRTWIDTFFPFLSSIGFATDKILIKQSIVQGQPSGVDDLLASTTGFPLTPTPAPHVTWEPSPDPEIGVASPIDLSVLVEGWSDPVRATGTWSASLIHYGSQAEGSRPVTVRFHPGFPEGTYTFLFFETISGQPGISLLLQTSVEIGACGGRQQIVIPGVLGPECHRQFKVTLSRTGPGPSTTDVIDFGVSPRDVRTVPTLGSDPQTRVTFRSLGNDFGSPPPSHTIEGFVKVDLSEDAIDAEIPGNFNFFKTYQETLTLIPSSWDPNVPTDDAPLQPVTGDVSTEPLQSVILASNPAAKWIRITAWHDQSDDVPENDRTIVIYRVDGSGAGQRLTQWFAKGLLKTPNLLTEP